MELKDVKSALNQTVYYDMSKIYRQEGNAIKGFIFTGCTIRKNKRGELFYQAELSEKLANSLIIVKLEDVKLGPT